MSSLRYGMWDTHVRLLISQRNTRLTLLCCAACFMNHDNWDSLSGWGKWDVPMGFCLWLTKQSEHTHTHSPQLKSDKRMNDDPSTTCGKSVALSSILRQVILMIWMINFECLLQKCHTFLVLFYFTLTTCCRVMRHLHWGWVLTAEWVWGGENVTIRLTHPASGV